MNDASKKEYAQELNDRMLECTKRHFELIREFKSIDKEMEAIGDKLQAIRESKGA